MEYNGFVLPPETSLRPLVATYARLRTVLGEAVGQPELIRPTGEHFPDAFAPEPASIARLFSRMVSFSPLADDLPVELAFVTGDDAPSGGCGSGACGAGGASRAGAGAVEDLGDRYRVFVPASDASNPLLLTATLARAVGALVLHEGGEGSGHPDEASAEICAAMCGFGVLLANGSEVWGKSCHGLQGIRATALSVEESATALSLFTATHAVDPALARRHLEPTQRDAFDDACEWVESNPLLVDALRRNPAWLENGAFDLEPVRGIVGRWLHKRRVDRELRTVIARPKAAPSGPRSRYLEEARALVDDTFDGG